MATSSKRPPRGAAVVRDAGEELPDKYAQLGARELLIFDPGASGRPGSERVPLQIYTRTEDGIFLRRCSGSGPAPLETLGLHAVVVRTPAGPWLRLARDALGTDLVPTEREAERIAARERDAERQARHEAETARLQAETERDAERRARESLERELRSLKERLGEGG